ncbi:MAG: hypothetical protein ACLT3H_05220 [Roseburia sp.]
MIPGGAYRGSAPNGALGIKDNVNRSLFDVAGQGTMNCFGECFLGQAVRSGGNYPRVRGVTTARALGLCSAVCRKTSEWKSWGRRDAPLFTKETKIIFLFTGTVICSQIKTKKWVK